VHSHADRKSLEKKKKPQTLERTSVGKKEPGGKNIKQTEEGGKVYKKNRDEEGGLGRVFSEGRWA